MERSWKEIVAKADLYTALGQEKQYLNWRDSELPWEHVYAVKGDDSYVNFYASCDGMTFEWSIGVYYNYDDESAARLMQAKSELRGGLVEDLKDAVRKALPSREEDIEYAQKNLIKALTAKMQLEAICL